MSDKPESKATGLIPGGNNSLTPRSFSLVRRGLEDLISKQARIIRFPPNRSMGTLHLWGKDNLRPIKKGPGVEARGAIAVPLGKEVELRVSDDAASDLSPLSDLQADDLQQSHRS